MDKVFCLTRRGRPPRVNETEDGLYLTTVKGQTYQFKRQADGLRLVGSAFSDDDADYAQAVVQRYIGPAV